MARYAVTFHIHSDYGYESRYESFITRVREGVTRWWAQTTSFYAIETTEDLESYCSRIYLKSSFDQTKDIFVVVNILTGEGRARGIISDKDLFKAFPGVIQL